MSEKRYRQYKLVSGDNGELVCWLKSAAPLRVTNLVRLKEIPDRLWVVREVYKTPTLDHPPQMRWRVGGLT